MQYALMSQQMEGQEEDDQEEELPKERKLKKKD